MAAHRDNMTHPRSRPQRLQTPRWMRPSPILAALLASALASLAPALARAVRWHAEHRVLLNGHRTIVFR